MLGLDLRSPQRLATSSGSISLNSPPGPSQQIHPALLESASSSSRNCHNCICPEPAAACATRRLLAALTTSYGSADTEIRSSNERVSIIVKKNLFNFKTYIFFYYVDVCFLLKHKHTRGVRRHRVTTTIFSIFESVRDTVQNVPQ